MKTVRPLHLAVFVLLPATFCVSAQTDAQATSYHIAKSLPVGGDGGWDYLTADWDGGRLYLSRSTHVMVLDLASGIVVGDIQGTRGVHGIAIVSALNRGFTSNGADTSVTIFDSKTFEIFGKVTVTGAEPDAILYDPFTKRVFTMNHAGGNATAIDAATGKVVGTAIIGGALETGVSDNAGTIYVNVEDRNEVVAFDAKTMDVKGHWPLTGCESPTGLAIDRQHARLFASCSGSRTMAVVDYKNGGKIVATIPICQGTDGNAFDPGLQLVFASCADGNITAVHEDSPDTYTVVQTIVTERGARTMSIDEKSHRLYSVTAQYAPAPPPPAGGGRAGQPSILPGSIHVLVIDKQH
jgi:DNA-binding beta-propeller fold protein YncE